MKTWSRAAVAAALMALLMAVVPACGRPDSGAAVVQGPWEDVVAAARQEGNVNLYSVAPPIQNEKLVAAFNQMYPDIKVTVTRGAGEMPGRVAQEMRADADGADVFLYTDPQFFVDNADEMLDIDGPHVEGWSQDFWAQPGKAIIPTKYPWTVFLWNTELFPNGFAEWDDLLAPEVKGKLAMRNDVTASMAGTLQFMIDELGSDYVTALAQQDPKFYTSAVPMGQSVASGESGVTFISTPSIVQDLQSHGAPVASALPSPGFAIMWGGGAPATSKRPNAARVFLDFIMSEEGQTALNGGGLGAAGRAGIDGALNLDGWEFFDSSQFDPKKMNEMKGEFEEYFGD